MGTTDGYQYRDALRVCDICGVQYHKSELTRIGPLRWACKDDKDGLTAEQIDRHNASVRPLIVRPVKNAKPPGQVPTYQMDEADILNLILKYAPQQVFSVESGDFGANVDTITGVDVTQTTGWMAFYLGNLVLENRRPRKWIEQAKVKLLSLADNVLANQFGPTGAGLYFKQPSTSIDSNWGAVYIQPPAITINVSTWDFDIVGNAVCMLALLRAWQASGTLKYRDGARRLAIFLRRAQCVGLLSLSYAQENPSGARFQPGPFPATVRFDSSLPAIVAPTSTSWTFQPSGIAGAWAMSELLALDGDASYGGGANTDFFPGSLPAALLSVAIQQCVDWWTNGHLDGTTNTVVVGFGSATPKVSFQAPAAPSVAPSAWAFSGNQVGSFDWTLGIRSLWKIGGYTAKVSEIYSWFRNALPNVSNEVPVTWSHDQIAKSVRGTYDPNLCLATIVDTSASDVLHTGYDWRTVGLLAPIQSARDPGSLRAAKDTFSRRLKRRWRMRMNGTGSPLSPSGAITTVEAAQYFRDPDTQDDPRLLTQTGLSMQTASGLRRSGWIFPGLINGHYIDLQGAAIIADVYRYPPGSFAEAQG